MLRQKDIIKYKAKSKKDQILFLRKDAEYYLKNNRPIKNNIIKSLNNKKMGEFIEDILKNKKISSLLFTSNSKYEIRTYLKMKQKFFTKKNVKPKSRKNEDNLTKKRTKKEIYLKMKNEIHSFKKDRQKLRNSMDAMNHKKIEEFKKELDILKNDENKDIKRNRINGFIRAYSTIKSKFDFNLNQSNKKNKNNSFILSPNYNIKNKNRKNNKKKSLSNETTESAKNFGHFSRSIIYSPNNNYNDSQKINLDLPHVKLDIKDVYNRLYHNVVLLSPSSTDKLKKPMSSNSNIKKRNNNFYKHYTPFSSSNANRNKINFNLKKVVKSTSGKEFTLKITKDIIKKAFIQYSGGPTVLKMRKAINEKNENNGQNNFNNQNEEVDINDELEEEMNLNKVSEDFVNYYKLIDKKTGNSFLHLAVIGGYDDFVRYFIEKKADINMKNFDGNTPLHLALKSKNNKIIDILMTNKPKLDIPNNKGEIQFDLFTDKMKQHYNIDKLSFANQNKK